MNTLELDYMDVDMAYLMGLIIGRGKIDIGPPRKVIIHFPHSSTEATGIKIKFDQENSIKLGIADIRERIEELVDTKLSINYLTNGIDMVLSFNRNSLVWRNILLITNDKIDYTSFSVPTIFLNPDAPRDWKKEFIKGFGDVAGNIRKANNYIDGRHRVRLDVLNYKNNWSNPVDICCLLQEHLNVPVQNISWGHPNMNREFREHQLNIFADIYLQIGFSFEHKQRILEELAEWNRKNKPTIIPQPCPGKRPVTTRKSKDSEENNSNKLDERLVGKHFNSYWQICKALGCTRKPKKIQYSFDFLEDSSSE